jgi:hypothetical protein
VREERTTDTGLQVAEYLVDLEQDPQEQLDLNQEQVDKTRELRELLTAWKERAPVHRLHFNHFPHPGWSPPKDWNKALVDSTNIDLGYSKDKRRSQSLQVKFRERIMQWLND